MFKKPGLLAALLALLVVAAGCVDLFAVPGIGLSPDGSSIVYLSGEASLSSDDAEADNLNLVRMDFASGTTTTLSEGSGNSTVSAFAVNPANGDVAYLFISEETGSSLMLVGVDGTSRELIAPADFPGISLGTMMQFSPDGSKLAYTVIQLPPEITLESLEGEGDDEDLTQEQIDAIIFAAYVYDMASGAVTTISDPDAERAMTLAWSPAGDKLAYNAWYDSNDDGTIATSPDINLGGGDGAPSDVSRISVYDFGTGSATPVDDSGLNVAPEFLWDSSLAFVSADSAAMNAPPVVKVADLANGSVNTVYAPPASATLGVALSPDGTQVAWVEFPPASDDEEATVPASLYVSGVDFGAPRKVADLPLEMQLTDIPVWMPDGASILVSVTNVLASLPQQISASFSSDGESSVETEGGSDSQVVQIDLASGKIVNTYTGTMINSSFFAGLFSFSTANASSDLVGDE
jgi:Tol biopolymer transport system component